MRVVFQEIKKIFNPVRTLAVLVFAVVIFSLYVAGAMNDIFANAGGQFSCVVDIFEKFGTRLSADERAVFDSEIIQPYREVLAQKIAADEYFQTAGIKNIDDLEEFHKRAEYARLAESGITDFENYDFEPGKEYTLSEADKKVDALYRDSNRYADISSSIMRINTAEGYIQTYDRVRAGNDIGYFEKLMGSTKMFRDAERARCNELYKSGEIDGIMNGICNPVQNALTGGAALLILSLFALMAPVLTADNMTGTNLLQVVSKTGRGVYKNQFYAMLAVALAFITAELAAFTGLFYYSVADKFIGCTLNTFYAFPLSNIYFFRGTLGEYILCTVGMTYAFVLCAVSATFILSKSGKHHISLLFKAVPAAAALTLISCLCTKKPFAFQAYNATDWMVMYKIIPIPYIEVYVCVTLFTVMTAAVLIVLKRQKRKEML